MPLWNVSRSRNREEGHFWQVDWWCAAQDPDPLKVIESFVKAEMALAPSEFGTGDPAVFWFSAASQPNKVTLAVFAAYSHNGANAFKCAIRNVL